MKKKIFRQGVSGLLMALLVFTAMPVSAYIVKAEEPPTVVEIEQEKIGGLKDMEVTMAPAIELEEGESPVWSEEVSLASDGWSQGTNSTWASYGSYYFYNQMSGAEKEFYDQLMNECLTYVNGGGNLTANENGSYYLPRICSTYSGDVFDQDTMTQVYYLFRYENPQFYYLMNGCSRGYTYSSGADPSVEANRNYYILPKVYPSFATGSARATAANTIQSAVQTYINAASGLSGDAAKIKKIHDMLTENVMYNYDAISGGSQQETASYSQSVYSTFTTVASVGNAKIPANTCTTVCAGYAGGFAMICNKMGIDALVITSSGHAWNRVEIDDVWYTIDCTWDDTDQTTNVNFSGQVVPCSISNNTTYNFYLRSDTKLKQLDSGGSHNEEAIMTAYALPSCTLDCEPSGDHVSITYNEQNYTVTLMVNPGTPGEITDVTATPSLSQERTTESEYTVTLTDSDVGAAIYYTTDGSAPELYV